MPPSPSMRISPGRELRGDSHKRGRSLDRGVMYRQKDDDLALFNEVQHKESENFLLQSNDDFDDIFATKLKSFSNHKLGISIPARGESSDLLNAEEDKNDYDWLITPPETPLFSSLDDEAPTVNLAPRGRPRSQPVSLPRSSTMEKSYRSVRGSPSPQRLSPSPRSGNSPLQSRSRPLSATHSSPPPTLRHSPTSRGLSPPPSKSTPPPRSSSPASRRISTGSASVTSSSRVRGTSPIKTSRGNSTSPKLTAWQTNIPGFSSEAPPNLRTSLADRPASYVRGTSPASRNGSRSARQSMSPTASRSVSSSHSHERDHFSSHSKGSVASSGDDDVDSLLSIPVSSSDRSAPRSIGIFPKSRAVEFSKKPTKTLSNSAPKRSFDLALRQVDRKGPQNMFRPLLSSVPSSTLYAGKASAHHHSLTSRNSSITTSSNASSDLGTSGVHDTEESEQTQEDVTSDCVKGQYPQIYDEVFVMDQVEALQESVVNNILEESTNSRHGEIDGPSLIESQFHVTESSSQLETATRMDTSNVDSDKECDYSDADGTLDTESCSACGRRFHSNELVSEGDVQLCFECRNLALNSITTMPLETVAVGKNTTEEFAQVQEHEPFEVLGQSASFPESLGVTCTGENGTNHLDSTTSEGQRSYQKTSQNLAVPLIEEGELTFATQQLDTQIADAETGHQQSQHLGMSAGSKTDVSEGAGISLLLNQSSTGKRHIVQSRSFTASNISYDDFSYVTDSVNNTRSSIGRSSASVSSSVDLGSSKQTETRYHWQISGRKSETESYRHEMPTKHKRSISSLSGASNHVFQVQSVAPSCEEDSFEAITKMDKEVGEATCVGPHEHSVAFEFTDAESTGTDLESNDILKTVAELSSRLVNVHSADTSSEEPESHEKDDNSTNDCSNSVTVEISSTHLQTSTQGVDTAPSLCTDEVDGAEVPNRSSFDAMPGMDIDNADTTSSDTPFDIDSTNSKSGMNELPEPSVSRGSNDVLEESTIVLEDVGGTKARSLTLDEATDAILFCSSIVHNLAYDAANIAIDKENLQMEKLRPTVTFTGKSNSDRREMRSRTVGKRGSKFQKARQRRLETDTEPSPLVAENNEKPMPRIVEAPNNGDTMKPPKLESKCNCTIM